MKEAIEKGVLCRYQYYPHIVRLTDGEMVEYNELSKQIAKYCLGGELDFTNEKLKFLLLARKRIIHKAENKLDIFKQIVTNRFDEKGNLREGLEEIFRFKEEHGTTRSKVQETVIENEVFTCSWRDVRPIPSDDDFFENVWSRYRENKNIY